ncbi:MAG: CDC27 family protein [Bacteroidetes bacterium]|nr:CDC27 family protein [Bacteroidota bacterium]
MHKAGTHTHLTARELELYSTGTMDIVKQELVKHHLAQCDLCREALDGAVQIPDKKILYQLPYTWSATRSKSIKHKPLSSTFNLWHVLLVVAVLCVTIGVYVTIIFNNKKSEPVKTEQKQTKEPTLESENFIAPLLINHAAGDTLIAYQKVNTTSGKIEAHIEQWMDMPKLATRNVKITDTSLEAAKSLYSLSFDNVIYIENYKLIKPLTKPMIEPDALGIQAKYKDKNEQLADAENIHADYHLQFAGIVEHIHQQQYADAIYMLERLSKVNPDDKNCIFYSALCYELMQDYTKAIAGYQSILSGNINAFSQEAEYHLLLCYRQLGNITAYNQLLTKISNSHSHYSAQARKLAPL